MYAQLGNIIFPASTGFQEFSHKTETSVAIHDRIDGKPRLQKTGEKLDVVSIKLKYHFLQVDPEAKIQELEDAKILAEPMPLVFGNGFYVGDFVLSSVERGYIQTDDFGNILEVDITLGLLEYVIEDPEGEKNLLARKKGFANDENNPQRLSGIFASMSEAQLAALQLSASQAESGKLNSEVNEAENSPSTRTVRLLNAVKTLDKMAGLLSKTQKLIFGNAGLLTRSQGLLANIRGTMRAISKMKTTIQNHDLSNLNKSNQDVQNAMRSTSGSGSVLVSLSATRKPF